MKSYDVKNERVAEHDVDSIFLNRWSPRAMSGDVLTSKEIMSLFEAARWSPSNSNEQPWRFLYALQGSKEWPLFFDLLVEFNQMWAVKAGALIVVVSNQKMVKGEENITGSFDTGASWMSLALQARSMNLVAHGMAGFDYDVAREKLGIPEGYKVEAMIAVGKQGEIEELDERMQKNEKPGIERKPVSAFVREGKFDFE